MSKAKPIALWIFKILIAVILLRTVAAKFTGFPRSIELFEQISTLLFGNVDQEVLIRYGTGAIELATSAMLFIPKTVKIGALGVIGTMTGALLLHVLGLGFTGANFGLAVSAIIAIIASIGTILLQNSAEKHA